MSLLTDVIKDELEKQNKQVIDKANRLIKNVNESIIWLRRILITSLVIVVLLLLIILKGLVF